MFQEKDFISSCTLYFTITLGRTLLQVLLPSLIEAHTRLTPSRVLFSLYILFYQVKLSNLSSTTDNIESLIAIANRHDKLN